MTKPTNIQRVVMELMLGNWTIAHQGNWACMCDPSGNTSKQFYIGTFDAMLDAGWIQQSGDRYRISERGREMMARREPDDKSRAVGV